MLTVTAGFSRGARDDEGQHGGANFRGRYWHQFRVLDVELGRDDERERQGGGWRCRQPAEKGLTRQRVQREKDRGLLGVCQHERLGAGKKDEEKEKAVCSCTRNPQCTISGDAAGHHGSRRARGKGKDAPSGSSVGKKRRL